MNDEKQTRDFERRMLGYLDLLCRVAFKLTDDQYDAQLLAHDTVLKAWRCRRALQENSSLKPWLLRTLRHTFLSDFRPDLQFSGIGETRALAAASHTSATEGRFAPHLAPGFA